MAKYKVIPNRGLNIRTGPGINFPKISAFTKDTVLTSNQDKKENGWVYIDAYNGWVSETYLECVEPQHVSNVDTTLSNTDFKSAQKENESVSKPLVASKSILSPTSTTFDDSFLKYTRAYGAPPQFSKFADPPLYTSSSANYASCGRVYAETFLSNASILSICPCNVKYLPGFNTDKKDDFFKRLCEAVPDDIKSKLVPDSTLSGKLYEAVPAYSEFHNHFNFLARACAIFDGIGDRTVPGTSIPYKKMDWHYYTTKEGARASAPKNIFSDLVEAVKEAATAAVTDGDYIHFFLNQNGTSANENISTDIGSSAIEELFSGTLNSVARNLQFLTGGTIDPDGGLSADIESVFNSTDSNLFKAFGAMTSNYFKGGRIIFPQIINDCSYSKSFSCSATFISPYADVESIFLHCKLPTLALLSLIFPKQVAEDMYSVPFICRVFQRGSFNSDLAAITGMDVKRGGSDDLAWTIDCQSTVWEVSFTVTPLYNKMMLPSLKHPFLALGNNAMLEYLGTLCGVDLKANNIDTKIQLALQIIGGSIGDAPRSLAREVVSKSIDKWLAPIIQFTNR